MRPKSLLWEPGFGAQGITLRTHKPQLRVISRRATVCSHFATLSSPLPPPPFHSQTGTDSEQRGFYRLCKGKAKDRRRSLRFLCSLIQGKCLSAAQITSLFLAEMNATATLSGIRRRARGEAWARRGWRGTLTAPGENPHLSLELVTL